MNEKKTLKIADLNRIYEKANEVDSPLFSEQRSNVLLASGDHYSKKSSQYWARVRDAVQLNEEQKLRLTKNHTHRIVNTYINNIFSLAPGVYVGPKNEKELRDTKTAELNESVWQDWKQENNYREQVRRDCDDFVKIGEVAGKVYFDPTLGKLIGHEALIDEETEQPAMDEMGQQVPDPEKPVFSGKIVYERIYGFNLLREASTKDDLEEGMVILRKMVDSSTLKKIYKDDEEKLKFIQPGSQDTFTVFDGANGSFDKVTDQVMIREFYQPINMEFPEGYFWITTQAGVIEEGPLPGGIWPIIFTGMDEIQTTPRKRSIIKVLRPFQAEINRTASKIAETQITFDDKLAVMAGSKVTQAAKLPGLRVLNYTGSAPVNLPGRSGEQYLAYMQSQIAEMYQAANLEGDAQEKSMQSTDSIAELLKIARHKKKFSMYAEKIEMYEVKKCEKVLQLAKHHYNDDMLIPAIGRQEIVNIPEFRNSDPLCYRVKLEPSNDDYETKFGKHITFSTILQYVGGKLEKDDIGTIMRAMPYANSEKAFGRFTLDQDICDNMILALDRGEQPKSNESYNHKFLIKNLAKRTTEADFDFLDPQIQQNYQQTIAIHQQMENDEMLRIKRAQEQLIPASGPLVKCDMYVDNPDSPGKTERAKIPIDALRWLEDRLKEQGIELQELAKIQDGQVAEMADQFINSLGNSQQMPPSFQAP